MFTVERFDSSVKGVIYVLHAGDYVVRYVGLAHNGGTNSPAKRFNKHRQTARSGVNRPVADWIRKHGEENIQMCIIETFDEDTIHLMGEREMFHIAQNETYFHWGKGGLNYTFGGESNKGAVRSDDFKENLRGYRTGRLHTEESKVRMSERQLGEKNHNYGKKHSDETRLKMSASTGKGQHTRWHSSRGVVKPECSFCIEA